MCGKMKASAGVDYENRQTAQKNNRTVVRRYSGCVIG